MYVATKAIENVATNDRYFELSCGLLCWIIASVTVLIPVSRIYHPSVLATTNLRLKALKISRDAPQILRGWTLGQSQNHLNAV